MNWEKVAIIKWRAHIKMIGYPWNLYCRLSKRFTKHIGKENRFK